MDAASDRPAAASPLHDADRLADLLATVAEDCPRVARALAEVGPPAPRVRPAGFGSLLRIIIDQQVSTAAGAAIWDKTVAAFDGAGPTPEAVVAASEETLTACGLSRPKRRYVRALAERIVDGRLDVDALADAPDDAVRAALSPVPGIGPWSIDIYLLFCLGRTDVWPAGDLALQAACHALHDLPARPDAKAMTPLAEAWRPWRGAVALLLWRWYGRMLKPGGGGVPMAGGG
ncbi:DNA-3-methyladenine glycosylase II [Caenispirillum salinarum AK4]|uniref:DNA-3-methyladenine glycosylase II n=1 Tax=Caenispirillum salinarum AK4 TaxID=1238182 RepID=K9HNY2_9PROT|nr:DNA-3-methyladenine glycosylase [Caenispirillum salinarum]EKV32023.1 DNA-3-methyladenine glycosylase II [Caenispirillum salinarum AK4]